eukprot:5289591-Pleurochrysis_carterae.AAC.2
MHFFRRLLQCAPLGASHVVDLGFRQWCITAAALVRRRAPSARRRAAAPVPYRPLPASAASSPILLTAVSIRPDLDSDLNVNVNAYPQADSNLRVPLRAHPAQMCAPDRK